MRKKPRHVWNQRKKVKKASNFITSSQQTREGQEWDLMPCSAQTLTRQVASASRGSKVIASGQTHSCDVNAILPLVLVLQVSHHLQPTSGSGTPKA